MNMRISRKLRAFVSVVAMGMSVSAFGETANERVQAALNQLYPNDGWVASNVDGLSECGLNGTEQSGYYILTHPKNQTTPATLTRVGPITGTYPVLHLRVTSRSNATKKLPSGDWVLRVRVNGLQIGSDTTIASTAIKDFKFPLAPWANKGNVKIELDNVPGGNANWNYEDARWHLLAIEEDESVYASDCQTTVQAALDEKFPGWTVAGESTSVSTEIGLNGNAVVTHPFDRGIPCILTRTVELTGTDPVLVVKVASYRYNNTLCDWQFAAEINREVVIPRQEIRTTDVVEFRYPLARWLGQGPVEIRLFNWNGGTQDAWNCEWAFWHQIDIVEGQPTGEPALRYTYLKGQGHQFINTGYLTTGTSVFDCTVNAPASGYPGQWAAVFGGGAYDRNGAIGFWNWSGNVSKGTFGLCAKGVTGGTFPTDVWTDLNVDVAGKLASWQAVGAATPTTVAAASNALQGVLPVFIFDLNNDQVTDNPQVLTSHNEGNVMKLHSFRIAEGGTEVMNLVPYRCADGLKGLLDTVGGAFYPNVGYGEFLVGGIGYTVDGTRLVVHEGEMTDVDLLRTAYTAVEKVSAASVDFSAVTALPSFAVSEGTASFVDGVARTHAVDGTLTLAGGTTNVFDLAYDGCDRLTASGLVLSGVDADHPVTIRILPAGATGMPADAVYPLFALGETQCDLAFFRLDTKLPVELAIAEGQLVVRPIAEDRSLPEDYTPIAFIRSTGTQFIRTGVDGLSDTQTELKLSGLKANAGTALLGEDAWTDKDYLLDVLDQTGFDGLYFFGVPGGVRLLPLDQIDPSAAYRIYIGGGRIYFAANGGAPVLFADPNDVSNATDHELVLFGINNATLHGSSYALYGAKILDGEGRRLRDFVPCRNRDGEAGLYDLVEGVFYGNDGTGHFFGPDEDGHRLSHIRATGSQYVTINYNAVQDTKLEVEFGDVARNDNTAIFGKGAWTDQCYLFDILSGKMSYWGAGSYPGHTAADAPLVDETARYWVRVGEGRITMRTNGGGEVYSADANSVKNAASGTLAFFGNSNNSHLGTFSLYWAKLWDGAGALVRDLVPWRNADGQIGLLDQAAATPVFYPSSGSQPLLYGYAYETSGEADATKLIIYDGTLTGRDDITGYAEVEKVGWYALNAATATAYPGALTLAKGEFSLADATGRVAMVTGKLTIAGGVKVVLDLTAEGCDSFAPATLDLGGATAANPIRLEIRPTAGVDYSRPHTVISAGVPDGAESLFELTGAPLALSVENGALVMRYDDPDEPVMAVWTNGEGDGDLANPGNWATTNGQGQAVSAVPTAKTSVRLPDGCVFNCPAGSALAYRDIVLPASIGGDCDWTGLVVPIDRTIDLKGHVLRLANLNGTGTITDATGLLSDAQNNAYQLLDYLQSDGKAYIDTGYAHNANTKVDLKVAFHELPPATGSYTYQAFFGARTGEAADGQFTGWLHTRTDGSAAFYSAVNVNEGETAIAATFDTPYLLHLETSGPCSIDGETFDTGVPGANVLNDYLFRANEGTRNMDALTLPHSRTYFCRIMDGDTVVRDFVPVRRMADGTLGMLDKQHGVFYPNGGSGSFIAGDPDPEKLPGGQVVVTVPEGETLTDAGLKLSGTAKLVKDGAGTLEWRSTALPASVSVLVTNGVFRTVTSSSTLLGAGGSFKVANRGQLDLNQQGATGAATVYYRSLFLAGEGPDGSGALVNNTTTGLVSYMGRVVLVGDATIGGSVRIDVHTADNTNVTSEIFGPTHVLTIKTSPFLVAEKGSVFNVRSIVVVDPGTLAVNYGFTRFNVPEGLRLNGSMSSAWGGVRNTVVDLGANLPILIGANGGTFYNNSPLVIPYVIPAAVTVTDGGTFTIREGTGTYGCVTNNASCTVCAGAAATIATFNGNVRNDGAFELAQGTFNFAASSVLTGAGTIRMTGGTATLAGDVSQYGGEFRVSGGNLKDGFGTFAPIAVIDLTLQTEAVDATSHNWTTAPVGSTIRVDLGSRRFSRGEKVLSWTTAPTDVRFVTTDGRRRLEAKSDGLYVYSGFMLILR